MANRLANWHMANLLIWRTSIWQTDLYGKSAYGELAYCELEYRIKIMRNGCLFMQKERATRLNLFRNVKNKMVSAFSCKSKGGKCYETACLAYHLSSSGFHVLVSHSQAKLFVLSTFIFTFF